MLKLSPKKKLFSKNRIFVKGMIGYVGKFKKNLIDMESFELFVDRHVLKRPCT
jgi:hypothetical protein